MFFSYKLKKNEDFKVVMRKYKIKDWSGVWNLPANKKLRAKRKAADKVIAGDTLVLPDYKAKVWTIKFSGKEFKVPESELPAAKAAILKEIRTKFMKPLADKKKIYDDDYQYMFEIANGNGWMTGMMSGVVENLTGAKLPTQQMSATSTKIKALDNAVRKGDFAAIKKGIKDADDAINAYVKAAELYRRKMTDGSSKGVKGLELTRDGCFIAASALAVTAAGPVGVIAVAEVGAMVGGGAGFVKAASGEVGNVLANTQRSTEQIATNVFLSTLTGAASGALSGAFLAKFGGPIVTRMSSSISSNMGKLVAEIFKSEAKWLSAQIGMSIGAAGTKAGADVVAKVLLRSAMGLLTLELKKWLKAQADELVAAGKSVLKSATGKEKSEVIGQKIGDKLVQGEVGKIIVKKLIVAKKKEIKGALEAA